MTHASSTRVIAVILSLVVGGGVGLGMYTFVYAGGHAYLSSDPKVCVNCHVMREQYDGWEKSSHHAVAVCNDCHTPKGLVGKYATKASNGFWHSFAFTSGRFPEPLRIKPHNREITEDQCRRCHADIVAAIEGPHAGGERLSCVRCHAGVGHWTR